MGIQVFRLKSTNGLGSGFQLREAFSIGFFFKASMPQIAVPMFQGVFNSRPEIHTATGIHAVTCAEHAVSTSTYMRSELPARQKFGALPGAGLTMMGRNVNRIPSDSNVPGIAFAVIFGDIHCQAFFGIIIRGC